MACISPPELADMDLLAYLEGEADDRVAAHLERCPHCRKRAQALAQLQGDLMVRLHRFECPAPAELGEYHLGLLPRDQAIAVTRHLAECPRCAAEVAQLGNYLAELESDLKLSRLERAGEHVRLLLAHLVSGGEGPGRAGQAGLAPGYAALRGEESEPLFYQADEIQVALEVHPDADQPERWSILGLVMGVGTPRELEVHVWRAGQRVATMRVEDTGNFFIPNLTAGRYDLILDGPGVEIYIQELDVGNS
jgi:hypothetical protein